MSESSSVALWPNIELEVNRPGEWVETMTTEPDPGWRYKDAAGHGHYYDDGFPTLTWVSEPCTMGHGEDCDSEGHWECPLCREWVNPGTRMSKPVFISGPTSYVLTVTRGDMVVRYSHFGPEQMEAIGAALADAIQGVLADYQTEVRFGR